MRTPLINVTQFVAIQIKKVIIQVYAKIRLNLSL
jgi:hypothetical protein